MVGFDLDGVFIPDLKHEWGNNDGEVLNFRKTKIQPTFIPKGDYVIVTGRPKSDKQDTLEWVSCFLHNPPLGVYHDNTCMKEPYLYKASIINSLGITIFFESELSQVEKLTELCPSCRIVHFEGMINAAIDGLC